MAKENSESYHCDIFGYLMIYFWILFFCSLGRFFNDYILKRSLVAHKWSDRAGDFHFDLNTRDGDKH